MTETPARKPRPRRTFSAFGDVRRMPSEYEIVTHAQNWTMRQNRAAAFEQNPSSAANLWFLTYRDNSPLQATDWDAFRDPDKLTYRAYVNLQADAETRVAGVLEAHAEAGADASPTTLDPAAVAMLGRLFTPSLGLGTILEAEAGVPAADVAARARTARDRFLDGLLETADQDGTARAG
jgi:toluene monooxygenase system protein E